MRNWMWKIIKWQHLTFPNAKYFVDYRVGRGELERRVQNECVHITNALDTNNTVPNLAMSIVSVIAISWIIRWILILQILRYTKLFVERKIFNKFHHIFEIDSTALDTLEMQLSTKISFQNFRNKNGKVLMWTLGEVRVCILSFSLVKPSHPSIEGQMRK